MLPVALLCSKPRQMPLSIIYPVGLGEMFHQVPILPNSRYYFFRYINPMVEHPEVKTQQDTKLDDDGFQSFARCTSAFSPFESVNENIAGSNNIPNQGILVVRNKNSCLAKI